MHLRIGLSAAIGLQNTSNRCCRYAAAITKPNPNSNPKTLDPVSNPTNLNVIFTILHKPGAVRNRK